MALLDIVRVGEPVLRLRAADVPMEDIQSGKHRALVRNMVETMRKAPGVGLAAPQVGVALRIIVVEDAERLMGRLSEAQRRERERVPFPLTVLFNPMIELIEEDKTAIFFEGCLSVPGFSALTPRTLRAQVSGISESGEERTFEVSGWVARIFQHEIDHVNGGLYIDRMISRSFGTNEAIAAHYAALSMEDVRARFGC
jgi:peptide deformylase